MADDKLTAELAAIRERAEQITGEHDEGDCDLNGGPCTGHDAERMERLLRDLLTLASAWERAGGAGVPVHLVHAERRLCGGDLRSAISAALAGEDGDGD